MLFNMLLLAFASVVTASMPGLLRREEFNGIVSYPSEKISRLVRVGPDPHLTTAMHSWREIANYEQCRQPSTITQVKVQPFAAHFPVCFLPARRLHSMCTRWIAMTLH